MAYDIKKLLTAYVEALRPIIYINHFDFKAVDALIASIDNNVKIYEYCNADGPINFNTKAPESTISKISLEDFLYSVQGYGYCENVFLILKDIHTQIKKPEIISRLKSIAERNIYNDGFYVTIFLVSTKLEIPAELENYITILEYPTPDQNEIVDIIKKYISDLSISISNDILGQFSLDLKGLSEFQIIQILNLAYQNSGTINSEDREIILREKEQMIKKSGLLEIINSKDSINNIGGLDNLKSWLKKKAEVYKQLDKAIKYGVDIPKGIMIVGMPGCGKSLTAKATAKLFKVPLLRLDVGRLLGKFLGESEDNFRKALSLSENMSPCVLWIDEIEKAFSGVGDAGSGGEVTTRLFGNMLTWLQEKDSSVFLVATANDISKLPAEFLRKGRFDELFFVDFPNSEERRKIFEIHLKKRGKVPKGIDILSLVQKTEGYNGADIEAVIKETIENSFINNKNEIVTEDFLDIIEKTKSITKSLGERMTELKKAFGKLDIKPASK